MCACRLYGRVKAYQFGTPDAFFQHTTNSLGINEAYLSGISITLGGTLGMPPHSGGMDATHISFSTGATQSTADGAVAVPVTLGVLLRHLWVKITSVSLQ